MLAAFFGPRGSPEMMSEVLRESVRRIQVSDDQNFSVKIKVAIGGWGNLETYEIAGKHLVLPRIMSGGQGLPLFELETRAQFTLTEAQIGKLDLHSHTVIPSIIDRVNRQQEKLTKLNVMRFSREDLRPWIFDYTKFFSLLNLCNEWRFDAFSMEDDNTNNLEWTALATASSTGQIGTLTLKTTPLIRGNQKQIRKV